MQDEAYLGDTKDLEKKLEKSSETSQNGKADEDEGKDLLIRELQNQLVTAKKETHQLSSGSHVTKLKLEIKSLKENCHGLKNRLKKEKSISSYYFLLN